MTEPKKIGTVTVVDAESGAVIGIQQNAMQLMPPPPHLCQSCAWDHAWEQPHNQQSMYWQYHFRSMHGRWPTWSDAMAHCTPEVKEHWRKGLIETMTRHGMEIPPDLLNDGPGVRS